MIDTRLESDQAPFFANLFLYIMNDLTRATKIRNLFRFIDDLNMINDGGKFENNFKDIYSEELQLNKDNFEASFLDFQIKIQNGKFIVGLFDKRNNFSFSVVRMPYKSSNLKSNLF